MKETNICHSLDFQFIIIIYRPQIEFFTELLAIENVFIFIFKKYIIKDI